MTTLFRRALCAAVGSLFLVSTGFAAGMDGPYIRISDDGSMKAWYAEPDLGESFKKRIAPVRVGERVTIATIGRRPAFQVELRADNEIPDPAILDWPDAPVFLIADIQGEFEIATELLIRQGVIDEALKWFFGKGHLVVLGDVFGQGENQTEILWLLYKLQAEAQAAGGAVHYLIGNAEKRIFQQRTPGLHPRYGAVASALGVGSYPTLWGTDTLLGRWLRSKPTVLKLGRTLCVNAGLSPRLVGQQLTVQQINDTVRVWANGRHAIDDPALTLLLNSEGPFSYSRYFRQQDPDNGAKPQDVKAVLNFYDAERIAVAGKRVESVTVFYEGAVIALHVDATRDAAERMRMEGVYIDSRGLWHKAKIDGGREPLKNDNGKVIRNSPPTPL